MQLFLREPVERKGSPKCRQQPSMGPSDVALVTHLMGVAYRSKPGRLCLRCRESASLSMSAAKSRPTTCQHRITGCITPGLQPGSQCAGLHEACAAILQVFHHRPKTLARPASVPRPLAQRAWPAAWPGLRCHNTHPALCALILPRCT